MRKLDRRVHMLLDERRHAKLAMEAKRRNVSIAEVIRDAIDRLPAGIEARRTAIDRILATPPAELPVDPSDLRREIDLEHERSEHRG